ncbi:hypothetical protein THAOC_32049, partial [Thalassiosira oceanica]
RKYAEGDGGAVGLGFSGSHVARAATTFVTGGVEGKSKEDATFCGTKPQPAGPAVAPGTEVSSNTLVRDQPTESNGSVVQNRRRKRRWDNPESASQGQPSSQQDTSCLSQHPATQQQLVNVAQMHAETNVDGQTSSDRHNTDSSQHHHRPPEAYTSFQANPTVQSSQPVQMGIAGDISCHAQPMHPDSILQPEPSVLHDDVHAQVERIRNARLIATRLREEQALSCRLKNLEYVMKREQSEIQQHVECVNQIASLEEKQDIQIQIMREQQRQKQELLGQRKTQRHQSQMLNENSGGIGSKEQRRAETLRKRHHSEQRTSISNTDIGESLRTSLYLTNLPTDGSCDERALKSLFCLFGRLDRVTMYRDRSTGDLKGDGLIAYGRDAALEHKSKGTGADLVETVCSQLNGAELACGTAIHVEPASKDYKRKANSQRIPVSNSPAEGVSPVEQGHRNEPTAAKGEVETGGELDDFFASLE